MENIKSLVEEFIKKKKINELVIYRENLETKAEAIMNSSERRNEYLMIVKDIYRIGGVLGY